jgi:hypothetical protein
MIEIIALLVFMVLIDAALIAVVISIYQPMRFRDAWSKTWEMPYVPVLFAFASLLSEMLS